MQYEFSFIILNKIIFFIFLILKEKNSLEEALQRFLVAEFIFILINYLFHLYTKIMFIFFITRKKKRNVVCIKILLLV